MSLQLTRRHYGHLQHFCCNYIFVTYSVSCFFLQVKVEYEIPPWQLLAWEQTFQGILLSPHNVNQRVLQRMHTETVKGSRSLLEKGEKTTISVLNSCGTASSGTRYVKPEGVCSIINSWLKRKSENSPAEILREERKLVFSFCLVAHNKKILRS